MSFSQKFGRFLPFGLFLVPLLLLIPLFWDINTMEFNVFPRGYATSDIDPLNDDTWEGNSTIDNFTADSEKILLQYTLRPSEHPYPNVFVIFWLDKISEFTDLRGYKYLDLKFNQVPDNQRINIFIKTFQPGVSSRKREEAGSLRHLEKSLVLTSLIKDYRFYINEFVTPQWWYDSYSVTQEDVGKESLEQVKSIDIMLIHTSGAIMEENQRTVVIKEIRLTRPLGAMSYVIIIFLGLFYLAGIPLWFRFQKSKEPLKLNPQPVDYINHKDEEFSRIQEYIQANYHDPEISTKKMQEFLGIPSSRIFNLIKDKYNTSFKQLIHDIRVEEAKRLILNSDLRITEISYKLGFNDTSYFNKVFKRSQGLSPSEFRDKNFS